MEPQPIHDEHAPPPSVVRFSDREIDLAHQMRAQGLQWEPAPGMFVYDDTEQFTGISPLQNHVFIILDFPLFLRIAGSMEALKKHWIWLPAWEEAFQWLLAHGKNEAEILDRLRESVVYDGLSGREALYEQILAVLRAGKDQGAPDS
jgi:hypothetical protein